MYATDSRIRFFNTKLICRTDSQCDIFIRESVATSVFKQRPAIFANCLQIVNGTIGMECRFRSLKPPYNLKPNLIYQANVLAWAE